MKKTAVGLAVMLLILAGAAAASAVELKAGCIRAFDDNLLTVTSEDGGRLTIEAFSGTIPLENPVTDLPIEGGKTEIVWTGLTYGGEPIQSGKLTLRATLTGPDRTVEQTEITTDAGNPRTTVLCCLPAAQQFYADGKDILRIECAVSGSGHCEISIAPKDHPEEEVWHNSFTSDGKAPAVVRWDGRGKDRKPCAPGEYTISAWSVFRSRYVRTAEITLLEAPLPEPQLKVTGSLVPEDLSDDAAVWAALTAPVVIGDGPEGKGLIIMDGKTGGAGRAGSLACRTAGVAVLEMYDDGWVKVAGWRQSDGAYTEGYVKKDKLRVIRPNSRYGAVVDKKRQTMTVYENGRRLGTVMVSTGWTTETERSADTHSGVYLLGTRLSGFNTDGHTYWYPIRIDASNLIHQMGFEMHGGVRDFSAETATLGRKASHGCIRVDARITEENNGINAWWIWTHMGHDSKIIVTPED